MSDTRLIETKLRLISAQAESLADAVRNGKLWDRDLSQRVGEIAREVRELEQLSERR